MINPSSPSCLCFQDSVRQGRYGRAHLRSHNHGNTSNKGKSTRDSLSSVCVYPGGLRLPAPTWLAGLDLGMAVEQVRKGTHGTNIHFSVLVLTMSLRTRIYSTWFLHSCFEAMLLPSPFTPLAQAAQNLRFSLTPTSHLALPQSFCLGKGRKSSGYFPEDETQRRQPQQRQGPVSQCRENTAQRWNIAQLELQLLGILKMCRSLNLQGLCLHAVTQPRVGISGSPGRSCLYLPLGAVMLHIFFSSALKGHMKEQYL